MCPIYAQDISKICPRCAQDMPKIHPRYAHDILKICQRYSQDMPKISGIIWQNPKNITESLTDWVTDSPIWIQEMLVHLKMRMLCVNVITTVCLAGQVELKSFLGTCVNTGSSLDSCLLQLADKLKWGWRSLDQVLSYLGVGRWCIWLARDKAGNLVVEQDGTRMVE